MSGIWKRIVAVIAANKFVAAISGWGSWFVSSWLYDDVLYLAAIAWLGPLVGGLIMATIAMCYTYVWIRAIVASEKDWFSMDKLHKIQKLVFWVVRLTKKIPFVRHSWVDKLEFALTLFALNINFDPMITTLYFRREDTSNTLNGRDNKIFLRSGLVSNGYWILRNWLVVILAKFGWNYFAN